MISRAPLDPFQWITLIFLSAVVGFVIFLIGYAIYDCNRSFFDKLVKRIKKIENLKTKLTKYGIWALWIISAITLWNAIV